jgi:HEAT repeat protein
LDARTILRLVEGLAGATNQSEVRSFLEDGVLSGAALPTRPRGSSTEPEAAEGGDRDARLALAREEAAFALASSPDPRAVDAVLRVVRDPGPGQAAAAEALVAFPPERVAAMATGPLSPALLHLAAAMGDLRALDAAHAALHATDPSTRVAALTAVSEMGDGASIAEAHAMASDPDARVRAAAASALVRLGAPERHRAVEDLILDDETSIEGIRLAAIDSDAGVVKALAAKVMAAETRDVRRLGVAALGRSESGDAVRALAEFVKDPLLEGDAAAALARSPSPGAQSALGSLLRDPLTRRLGARAFVLRAFTRGDDEPGGAATLAGMARSPDARDRVVGLGGLVLLGKIDADAALRDPDAGVRQAVAVAAMADGRLATRQSLLRASRRELDPVARRVEMAGLLDGDDAALVTTVTLAQRAVQGEADGPLATMALAARADPSYREEVDALLASSDPILRSHAARGMGDSQEATATGRLARAYALELDPTVRRAIVRALARRRRDANAPARRIVLTRAARVDPDPEVREAALQALSGLSPPTTHPEAPRELAWMRLASSIGDDHSRRGRVPASPAAARAPLAGILLRADGVAVPVAFDADGYALVPIPPGEARLLLEPHVPAYP